MHLPLPAAPSVTTASAEPAPAASWVSRVKPSVFAGMRLCGGAALGVWLCDAALLGKISAHVPARRWMTGAGSALFVALTTALVCGAVLGPLVAGALAAPAATLRRQWERFRAGDPGLRVDVPAHVLGGLVVLGAWTWFAYRLALAAPLAIARPATLAAALALSHLAFAGTIALFWPVAVRWSRRLVVWAARVPVLRWPLAAAWRLPALLVALALWPAWSWCAAHQPELYALPWQRVASAPGAVLGVFAAACIPYAPPRWRLPYVASALAAAGLIVGGAAAVRLHPESTVARKIAFDRMLSGRIGYAAWTVAFDFDGDGQLGMLGGGDCAPFDSRRYTGAADPPYSRAHVDCDDAVLTPIRVPSRPLTGAGRGQVPQRPSVVLITIDALGAPRLGAYGGPPDLMPEVNDFATHAAVFTHCFSQGPSTRLSFPSIFTSRWDSQLNRVYGPRYPYSLAPSERQLQELISGAGYETVAVLPSTYFEPTHWASVTRGFGRTDTAAVPSGKHNAPQVTDEALRVLEDVGDRPLYMWVHYYDAHGPYLPLPGTTRGSRTEQELYTAELSYIDHSLGRLLAALKARATPTYVVLTADHATVFHPDPSLRRAHYGYDLYTATLHVPLVIYGPGIAPERVDGLVSSMDIAPTVAELLRLREPRFEGTSLMPELFAGAHDPDRVLFHEFFLPERGFRGDNPLRLVSVRSSRYNLVLDRVDGGYELYDWRKDYYEENDLYEDLARTPEIEHLRSLVRSFARQFDRRDGVQPPRIAPGRR